MLRQSLLFLQWGIAGGQAGCDIELGFKIDV
jgi:hypothetical protein